MHTSIISTVGICLCYVFNFIQIFIFQDSMPDLFSHFQYNEIETHMYASQWFLTLFTAKFPLSMVYRIMDLFLCHVSGPAGTQLRNQERVNAQSYTVSSLCQLSCPFLSCIIQVLDLHTCIKEYSVVLNGSVFCANAFYYIVLILFSCVVLHHPWLSASVT